MKGRMAVGFATGMGVFVIIFVALAAEPGFAGYKLKFGNTAESARDTTVFQQSFSQKH